MAINRTTTVTMTEDDLFNLIHEYLWGADAAVIDNTDPERHNAYLRGISELTTVILGRDLERGSREVERRILGKA